MPPVPYRYYIRAYVELLKPSRVSANDETDNLNILELAGGFVCLVETDLKYTPRRILPIMEELMPTLEFISVNPARYEYGSHPAKIDEIRELYKQRLSEAL